MDTQETMKTLVKRLEYADAAAEFCERHQLPAHTATPLEEAFAARDRMYLEEIETLRKELAARDEMLALYARLVEFNVEVLTKLRTLFQDLLATFRRVRGGAMQSDKWNPAALQAIEDAVKTAAPLGIPRDAPLVPTKPTPKRHGVPAQLLGLEGDGHCWGTEGPWTLTDRGAIVVETPGPEQMRTAMDPYPTVARLPTTLTRQRVDGYLMAAAPTMYSALVHAARVFRGYAEHHRASGKLERALDNTQHAQVCEEALAAAQPRGTRGT